MMKRILFMISFPLLLAACSNKEEKGKFILSGQLKNTEDQKIYLEQVFFSQKDPEVLDTAEIKNGKFEVSAIGNEEGLYRLRMEKQETGYIFINDKSAISFTADAKDMSISGPDFNTPANHIFKSFLSAVDDRQRKMETLSAEIDSLQSHKASDSMVQQKIIAINADAVAFKTFIIKSIDSISDPVVAMFALGYTRNMDPKEIKPAVDKLGKKFPDHKALAGIVTQFNEMLAQQNLPKTAPAAANGKIPAIGDQAPELMMNDAAGKPFALSSLKGKYVLVDFWASWCGPCRGENPNVVANYKKYKDRNFTILGVSLDDDKASWLNAIKKDGLEWTQISDGKGWLGGAVAAYGFEAIPYNVLLDPQGKIIAIGLREEALGNKLAEVLK